MRFPLIVALMALAIASHIPQTSQPTTPYCPIAAEVVFSNTYGAPRPNGRTHKGTDVFAVYGAPIVAPEAGTITFGFSRLGGTVARLQANFNYYYFAHLSAWATEFVQSGDLIEAGWVIAYVGNSGNARYTEPHLHIETRVRGQRANPYNWLIQSCTNKTDSVVTPVLIPYDTGSFA